MKLLNTKKINKLIEAFKVHPSLPRITLQVTKENKSRLTRARGLKRDLYLILEEITMSRLTRARGLKQIYFGLGSREFPVAPHAGAWIETHL